MFALLFLFALLVAGKNTDDFVVGYWRSPAATQPSDPPKAATHGFAYSGLFIEEAIPASEAVKNDLPNTKILVIGGENKRWTKEEIDKATQSIESGAIGTAGYSGVMWYLEQGEQGLGPAFVEAFGEVKEQELENWVTFPHSTPFGFGDTEDLMSKILKSRSVDFISPQLYTDTTEDVPDFSAGNGVDWTDYKVTHARIVPSILSGANWQAVFCYFQNHELPISGYLQRLPNGFHGEEKLALPPCPKPIEDHPKPKGTLSCGTSRVDAQQCGKLCPSGKNSDCPYLHDCHYVDCDKSRPTKDGNGEIVGAIDSTVTTESTTSDGTVTTMTITTSDDVPGYAVALLVFASLVIVVLFILVAMVSSRKKPERV